MTRRYYPHRIIVEKFDKHCGMWEHFREFDLPDTGVYPSDDYKLSYRKARTDALVSFHPDYNTYPTDCEPRCRIVEVVSDVRRLLWEGDEWKCDHLEPYMERSC